MRNRIVGLLIIGIAILIGFIIFSFNITMSSIIEATCSHGQTCPMWGSIDFQTNMSIAIMIFVIVIGLYLVFFGEEKKIITRIKTVHKQLEPREITKENYQEIMKKLGNEEKLVLEKIIESKGTIFQSELVGSTGFPKVKITRILDRLEVQGVIERRRRGMSNVVMLKSNHPNSQ
ncbi:MAG: hypothetical protein ABIG30_03780 [Candidatus Aenigmatarchaeota archaeon]